MEETVLLDVQRVQTSRQSSTTLCSVRTVDSVNHLVPELHLLGSHNGPYDVRETVVNCLYAGQQSARERRAVLPLLSESLYSLGGIVIAAGKTTKKEEVITRSRLCEETRRLLKDEAVWESTDIIRSVALPVYHRLVREQRTHVVSLSQTLLYILAWYSESGWARDQAQRMLWVGGVFGAVGTDSLVAFDQALVEREMTFPSSREWLTVTVFLTHFPAGPVFSD